MEATAMPLANRADDSTCYEYEFSGQYQASGGVMGRSMQNTVPGEEGEGDTTWLSMCAKGRESNLMSPVNSKSRGMRITGFYQSPASGRGWGGAGETAAWGGDKRQFKGGL